MPRVLVIEDDPQLRDALGTALAVDGFDVQVVADVYDGCRLAADEPFDAVLSDVRVPGDGTTLSTRLRNIGCDTPVVLMTGYDAPGARPRALAAGASAYLLKPLDLVDLRRLLLRLCTSGASESI